MPVLKPLATALFVFGGPLFLFPDLLPLSARFAVLTVLTATAFGLALILLFPSRQLRWGLWLFTTAVIVGWAVMPVHDLLALRHFAGIGFGVLAMALVASWCTTTERILIAAQMVAVVSIAILAVGLVGTSVYTGKYTGLNELLAAPAFAWLPQVKLGLPGLEKTGEVNANGLAGTALMLLPMGAALAIAAAFDRPRRPLALVLGLLVTVVALAVLALTVSRTALIGTVVTGVVLGLCWSRGRWWILLAILVWGLGTSYAAYRSRAANPERFDYAMGVTRQVASVRIAVWQKALERLRASPWVGTGINQFHDVAPVTTGYYGTTYVAHAHNALLQVALDVGVPGLCGYIALISALLLMAHRVAKRSGVVGILAGGAGLSLVGVHAFGLADAIALGAKVGLFQWLAGGFILAASRIATLRSLDAVEGSPVQLP